jgi:hypothetical protein
VLQTLLKDGLELIIELVGDGHNVTGGKALG